jgi:hypothetical protein
MPWRLFPVAAPQYVRVQPGVWRVLPRQVCGPRRGGLRLRRGRRHRPAGGPREFAGCPVAQRIGPRPLAQIPVSRASKQSSRDQLPGHGAGGRPFLPAGTVRRHQFRGDASASADLRPGRVVPAVQRHRAVAQRSSPEAGRRERRSDPGTRRAHQQCRCAPLSRAGEGVGLPCLDRQPLGRCGTSQSAAMGVVSRQPPRPSCRRACHTPAGTGSGLGERAL